MKPLTWCALVCLFVGQAFAEQSELSEQQKQELKICNMDEIPLGFGLNDRSIQMDEKDQEKCRKLIKAQGAPERYKVCQNIFEKGENRQSCIKYVLKDSPCAKLRKNAPEDFQKCLMMQKKANKFAGCNKETGHHISCREGTYKFQGAFSPVEIHSGSRKSGKKGFIDYVQESRSEGEHAEGQQR